MCGPGKVPLLPPGQRVRPGGKREDRLQHVVSLGWGCSRGPAALAPCGDLRACSFSLCLFLRLWNRRLATSLCSSPTGAVRQESFSVGWALGDDEHLALRVAALPTSVGLGAAFAYRPSAAHEGAMSVPVMARFEESLGEGGWSPSAPWPAFT